MIGSGSTVHTSAISRNEQGRFRVGVVVAVATVLSVGIVPAIGAVMAQAQSTPSRARATKPHIVGGEILLKSGNPTAQVNGLDTDTSFCYQPSPAPTAITNDPATSITGAPLPHTCTTTASGAAVHPFVIPTPVSSWKNPPISGSKWVGPESSGSDSNESANTFYVYDAEFNLSCGGAAVTGSALADNQVAVFLNGHLLGSQANDFSPANYGGPALNFANLGFAHGGANVVDFVVYDHTRSSTGLDYSIVVTPACGTLKICKVAGPGVAVGSNFTFNILFSSGTGIGETETTVPAGPAPGGWCELEGPYVVSSKVSIKENIPVGDQVTSITSNVALVPPPTPNPKLSNGSVTVTIGTGVTVVTYADQHVTKANGYLEICKIVPPGTPSTPLFTFTVTGGPSVSIPAGACSPPLHVAAGPAVQVTETPIAAYPMTACSTLPAAALVSCTPPTATVKVAAGPISSETILTITDTGAETGFLEICKAIPAGNQFNIAHFTVNGQTISVTAGTCSAPISLPAGNYVVTEQPLPFEPMTACNTVPASALVGQCNLATQQATVTISPGDVSSATILNITDTGITS